MSRRKRAAALLAIAGLVWLAVILVNGAATSVRADDYDTKMQAAATMQACMDAVKGYKQQRGIELSPLDIHQTGMIGEEFNILTTTLGDIDAKRTTAHPDMAALAVQLLHEAGVQPGDRVGVNLSGSFPAMNIAVISACSAMDVEAVVYAAVGSSTYGGNNPGLSFPEMLKLLMDDGLLPEYPLTVTLGGGADCGKGMDEQLLADIELRLDEMGISPWKQPDFAANLSERMQAYGDIVCYVGVGGNVTSIGGDRELNYRGYISPAQQLPPLAESSGLVERYHAEGLPVIHLLNIKQLVEDYALPFDPTQPQPPGQTAIYNRVAYPAVYIVLALALVAVGLAIYRRQVKNEKL